MHMDIQNYIMLQIFGKSVKDNLKLFYSMRDDQYIVDFFESVEFIDCRITILDENLYESVQKYMQPKQLKI